jgi:hypothetical protein
MMSVRGVGLVLVTVLSCCLAACAHQDMSEVGASAKGGGSSVLPPPNSEVLISEIMYHPVAETSATDDHEFIELYNAGAESISLAGWALRVGKTTRLTLADGTSVAAGDYLVLAKNREKLLTVAAYALSPDKVIGDFEGGLDNGGTEVSIIDAGGNVKDSVTYDDKAPWPIGADAFGAQQDYLPELGDYSAHQYMGRSLERYSFTIASDDPRNWEASPVDAATPSTQNSVSGEPPAIVLRQTALGASSGTVNIAANESVQIEATLSVGAASDLAVEYRLDPLEKTGTSTKTVAMNLKSGTEATFVATLPGTSANTVVRYRIIGSRNGSDVGQIGPRTTDPRQFYAYFVAPPAASGRSYHLFISPQNWTSMWTNISGGRTNGCTMNANWDTKVPAVLVSDGVVYDVRVRYQGSYNRRTDGVNLPNSWSAPKPTQPSPLKVLSWKIGFPRYARLSGLSSINLNKLKQSCPGVLNAVEGAIMVAAGLPEGYFKFARFYINGGYYAYMMEQQDIAESLLQQFEGIGGDDVGDLFDTAGATVPDSDRSAGPYGMANFTPIAALCNMQPLQRYQLTYERQTNDWKGLTADGHRELVNLIETLNSIVTTTDANPAVRDYFNQYFDVPRLITQYVVRNWAGTWDDGVHNYLPYKRFSDGKWVVFGHDYDCDFGGDTADCDDYATFHNAPTLSFFHPETGNGVTASGPSQLKVQLIRAFRSEFAAQVESLAPLFSEDNVNALVDQVMAGFDRSAWQEAPVRFCDLDKRITEAKDWLGQRRAFLATGIR